MYIRICLLISLLCGLACTPEETSTYERFFFRNDGADLAVEVNGNIQSGVFILLLHGGPGGHGFEYNTGAFTEDMETDYAMVYLDQRGQGASQGNYAPEDVSLQKFSDDIYALSQFLKQKYGEDISLFLMGHSWGGTTGTHALLNTDVQDELNGWIEVAGAHDIPLLYKESIDMFIRIGTREIARFNNVRDWTDIIAYAAGVNRNNVSDEEAGVLNSYGFEAEALIEEIAEGEFGTASHGLFTSPVASLASLFSATATASAINAETESASMTDRLGEITIPSAFLWGEYDFVVPPALGESAFERVGTDEKRLIIFEQSGHSPMDNEPELFTQAVQQFIETYR